MPKESSFFIFSSKNRYKHWFNWLFFGILDEDDGQFEEEEDGVDKSRRMASESPVNKVVPIPEGTSFWIFTYDNS